MRTAGNLVILDRSLWFCGFFCGFGGYFLFGFFCLFVVWFWFFCFYGQNEAFCLVLLLLGLKRKL